MRPSCRLAPIVPSIWDISKITLATPSLFLPIQIGSFVFRDATKLANNPALIATEEVEMLHEQHPHLILSIGSGTRLEKENVHELQQEIDWVRSLQPSKHSHQR